MNHKKHRHQATTPEPTGNEGVEAQRLVGELMGNSNNPDKLLAIMNRHRELTGLRFGHVAAIALVYMTQDILEGTLQIVDIINPDHRANIRILADRAEFKSLTEQL